MSRARRSAALFLALLAPVVLMGAKPPPAPPGSIAVAGTPTGVVAFAGGDSLLAGFETRFGRDGGIALYHRAGGVYALVATVHTTFPVEGIALSPDGRTAVATTRVGLAAVNVQALALADGTAKVAEVRTGAAPDANQVVFSRDGAHAFFTVQRYAELGVAEVTPAEAGGVPGIAMLSRVPLDRSPGGLALSPDGKTLYVTSETDTADVAAVPGFSNPQTGRAKCPSNFAPNGVLSALDTAKAISDPAHALVARVAAGCGPTRVALAPDGSVAWVTVRYENRVVAFDTAKLRADPEHAFLTSVAVGDVPVGLALTPDGRTLLVANSHRSRDADDARAADLSVIDTAAALRGGKAALVATIPTGALAREVVPGPDGGFFVTNYLSKDIAIVKSDALKAAH